MARAVRQERRRSSAAAAASNRPIERSVPFTTKRPPDEFDIRFGDFEHGGGDAAAFLDDLVGGLGRHPGAEPHRARRGRAAAGLHPIGVAGDEPDLLGIDAEPFADDLREARLVPLARRHRAEHQLDRARPGSIVISARSRGAPVFSSIEAAMPMPRHRPRRRASARRASNPAQSPSSAARRSEAG